MFSRLQDAGLKVKFAKCVWAAAECRVLGSIVNEHGIMPDPSKVAAVNELPVPRNVADVRSFLGATGYFQGATGTHTWLCSQVCSLEGTIKERNVVPMDRGM